MSAITASYSTMQLPLVATLTLNWFAVGIAYCFEKAAKEKWERERPAREKAAREKADKEMKIATKLGVAVDQIVSKSLFSFCSFFSSYFFAFFVLHVLFLPCGFVLLLSILTFFSVHILLLIYFSLLSYNRSLFTQEQISFRKDTMILLKKD
jgi:hypothetical protein